MNFYLDAVLLALFLSIMTGPVFFALMDLTLQKGFWPAFSLATGVWVSDITYICLVYLGLSFISETPGFTYWVGISGGIILIVFGWITMFSKTKKLELDLNLASYISFFSKGFAINIFNPFVFIFWIGIVSNISNETYSTSQGIIFLSVLLVSVAILDVLKIYIADKIRAYMTEKHFRLMRIVAGVGLIVFGLALIYRSVAT